MGVSLKWVGARIVYVTPKVDIDIIDFYGLNSNRYICVTGICIQQNRIKYRQTYHTYQ